MPSIEEILRARNQQNLVAKVEEDAAARERMISSERQLWQWASDIFWNLPRRHLNWYRRLWLDGLLCCNDKPVIPRSIADYTTRILCSAIQLKRPLLVVLPEGQEGASEQIVATLTVLHSCEEPAFRQRNRLLYIGDRSGMRHHMHCARIEHLPLSSLFPYSVVKADQSVRSFLPEDSTLTELVCACRPPNVNKLINDHRPDRLLIDITGPDPKLWFPSAIEAAKRSKVPAVAWCNSHLCNEIEMARNAGWAVFSWCAYPGDQGSMGNNLRAMQPGDWRVRIDPSLIHSPDGSPGQLMIAASKALYSFRENDRPILRDARGLLNRTLRALSRLSVPLDYYEEESRFMWGLYPVRELLNGAKRYVQVTRDAGMPEAIERTCDLLDDVYCKLESDYPPLWQALEAKINRADDGRVLVFPTASSCRLFSGAISKYLGLSIDDLESIGFTFTYIKALAAETARGRSVVVVGAPTSYDWPRLWGLQGAGNVEILHYPHEFPLLCYHLRSLSSSARFDFDENLKTLAILAAKEPVTYECASPDHFILGPPTYCDSETGNALAAETDCYHLLPDLSPAAEWEKLVPDDDPRGAADFGLLDSDGSAISEAPVRIGFGDGRFVYFDSIDVVQTVVDGELVEKQARVIGRGDIVLIVDGQRRQNLYSLIVARLHDHPAVRVHLGLLERWWQEIDAAYDRTWRRQGRADHMLLDEIQSRGSSRVSVQAVQNWIRCIHCPEDPEDMRRVAEVLGMPFSLAHYRSVHKAAQRIHTLHRNISRRLNTWLQQQLAGYGVKDEVLDGVIDDEFHLTLRDFQDSIALLEVESVELPDRPIPRTSLGTLFAGE